MKQIRADIRYVVKGERSIFYPAEREKSVWPAEEHPMTLTDLRPLPERDHHRTQWFHAGGPHH